VAGNADCVNCAQCGGVKLKDNGQPYSKPTSLKCAARDQTMYTFKGFFCWFYKKG
jgi:hypothetical protein